MSLTMPDYFSFDSFPRIKTPFSSIKQPKPTVKLHNLNLISKRVQIYPSQTSKLF